MCHTVCRIVTISDILRAEEKMRKRMHEILIKDGVMSDLAAKDLLNTRAIGLSALQATLKDITREHHSERLKQALQLCVCVIRDKVCCSCVKVRAHGS
jgi:hypothetical protein